MPSNDLRAGQRALGEIFRAFEDFGVPSVVHTRMMATLAANMYWFGPDEMVALGQIGLIGRVGQVGQVGQVGAPASDGELRARLHAQLDLETALPEWTGPPPGITLGQIAGVERQRQRVAGAPNDAGARDPLGGAAAALGNFRSARAQKAQTITLRGTRATVADDRCWPVAWLQPRTGLSPPKPRRRCAGRA